MTLEMILSLLLSSCHLFDVIKPFKENDILRISYEEAKNKQLHQIELANE